MSCLARRATNSLVVLSVYLVTALQTLSLISPASQPAWRSDALLTQAMCLASLSSSPIPTAHYLRFHPQLDPLPPDVPSGNALVCHANDIKKIMLSCRLRENIATCCCVCLNNASVVRRLVYSSKVEERTRKTKSPSKPGLCRRNAKTKALVCRYVPG